MLKAVGNVFQSSESDRVATSSPSLQHKHQRLVRDGNICHMTQLYKCGDFTVLWWSTWLLQTRQWSASTTRTRCSTAPYEAKYDSILADSIPDFACGFVTWEELATPPTRSCGASRGGYIKTRSTSLARHETSTTGQKKKEFASPPLRYGSASATYTHVYTGGAVRSRPDSASL